jgi:hypothetical protein
MGHCVEFFYCDVIVTTRQLLCRLSVCQRGSSCCCLPQLAVNNHFSHEYQQTDKASIDPLMWKRGCKTVTALSRLYRTCCASSGCARVAPAAAVLPCLGAIGRHTCYVRHVRFQQVTCNTGAPAAPVQGVPEWLQLLPHCPVQGPQQR